MIAYTALALCTTIILTNDLAHRFELADLGLRYTTTVRICGIFPPLFFRCIDFIVKLSKRYQYQ